MGQDDGSLQVMREGDRRLQGVKESGAAMLLQDGGVIIESESTIGALSVCIILA